MKPSFFKITKTTDALNGELLELSCELDLTSEEITGLSWHDQIHFQSVQNDVHNLVIKLGRASKIALYNAMTQMISCQSFSANHTETTALAKLRNAIDSKFNLNVPESNDQKHGVIALEVK